MEKMYVINTGHRYYVYFNFFTFLINLNEESEFRDVYPDLRENLSYGVTNLDAAISQSVMLNSMDIGA